MAMALNTNGELRITARAPELGTASETITASIEGGYLHLGFNVAYFMDGLKALGNEQAVIEFSGEEGQTRMKREGSEDFLYMLMPARLSTQDAITEEETADFSADSESESYESESHEQEQESAPESEPQDDNGNSESDTPF